MNNILDIKIVRENNKFTTSVYRKPTFSGVFTNFESFIPTSYKYALIFTLLHRASKLFSELFHKEIENLKNIFGKNGYPLNFTDFCIKKYLNNLYVKKDVCLLAPKKQLTCVLPFFGEKSLQLRSRLVNSVNKTVRFCNLKVVFRSQRKLNTVFRFKVSLNKKIHSFLVYRYRCSNCDVTYYGKTYKTMMLYKKLKSHLEKFELVCNTEETIKKLLCCLDVSQAPEMDEMSHRFLKDGAEVLAKPNCDIIN